MNKLQEHLQGKTIRVIDVETTGLDIEISEIIEIAYVDVKLYQHPYLWESFSTLVQPDNGDIAATAKAIHHIDQLDLVGAPKLDSFIQDILVGNYYCGHSPDLLDKPLLSKVSNELMECTKWIDTFRLAKHLWPDLPSYSNQAIRYSLKLPVNPLCKLIPAHRALHDAYVTAHILKAAITSIIHRQKDAVVFDKNDVLVEQVVDVESLIEFSEQPINQRLCKIGKYFNQPWDDVPTGFLQWMDKKVKAGDWDNSDEDAIYTMRLQLEKRNG